LAALSAFSIDSFPFIALKDARLYTEAEPACQLSPGRANGLKPGSLSLDRAAGTRTDLSRGPHDSLALFFWFLPLNCNALPPAALKDVFSRFQTAPLDDTEFLRKNRKLLTLWPMDFKHIRLVFLSNILNLFTKEAAEGKWASFCLNAGACCRVLV
jgi:hypothetical protein